jgi:hypothetical protein
VPSSTDVLAILDRIIRQIAKRLAREACHDDDVPETLDVLAQVQAEAAATWRAPTDGRDAARGAERLRAWSEGFSLHAGVVIAEHDRDALERLCRYGARPAFAQERLSWTDDGRIAYRSSQSDARAIVIDPLYRNRWPRHPARSLARQ